MTTETVALSRKALQIAESDTSEALDHLHAPSVAAAIWARKRPVAFSDWLENLPSVFLPRFRERLAVCDVAAAADAACGVAGLPMSRERDALCADLGALAIAFGRLMSETVVEARLDVIDTDGCYRFHTDRVEARLLCTLRGPGSELGLPQFRRDVRILRRLAPGEVAILRGTLWRGEETGLLHRSPPIAGTGAIRLLFVLDPAAKDDDACECCS